MKRYITQAGLITALVLISACNNGGRGRVAGLNGTLGNAYSPQVGVGQIQQPVRAPAPDRSGVGTDYWGQFPSWGQFEQYYQQCLTLESHQAAIECQYQLQLMTGMRGLPMNAEFLPDVGLRGLYGSSGRITRWRSPYSNDAIAGAFFQNRAGGLMPWRSQAFNQRYGQANVYCQVAEARGIPCDQLVVDPMQVYCNSALDEINYLYEIGNPQAAQRLSYAILPQVHRLSRNNVTFHNNMQAVMPNIWQNLKGAGANALNNIAGSFINSLASVRLPSVAPISAVRMAPIGTPGFAPFHMAEGNIFLAGGGQCAPQYQQVVGYEVVCTQITQTCTTCVDNCPPGC